MPLSTNTLALTRRKRLLSNRHAIYSTGATPPPSLEAAKGIPTLKPLDDGLELKPYAAMLANTLNGWASGALRVSAAGGVDTELGLAMVELTQAKTAHPFKPKAIDKELGTALQRLQQASTEQSGRLAYLRGICHFDGPRIHIVKPALVGQWTRTGALNDAADLYAHIAEARRQLKPA